MIKHEENGLEVIWAFSFVFTCLNKDFLFMYLFIFKEASIEKSVPFGFCNQIGKSLIFCPL